MTTVYDGLVSRHLNRHFSRPIARALSHTPATPNQVSVCSLLLAVGSLAAFAAGQPILGGVLAQTSSIVDGVDGDLARLTGQSSAFGGFFDAILDRYSDGLILLGLTIWAAQGANKDLAWAVGFVALAGSYTVTYTRARIDEGHRRMFDRGLSSMASRDLRLLLVLAALTNTIVLVRVISARVTLGGASTRTVERAVPPASSYNPSEPENDEPRH
jgi:phosphatidylglycerophosphate synthase